MGKAIRIGYKVQDFSFEKVKAHYLVAMVKGSVQDDSTIYSDDANFKGAGIATYFSNANKFDLQCGNVVYSFSKNGYIIGSPGVVLTTDKEWKLMLATVIERISTSGNAITRTNVGHATRTEGGTIEEGEVDYSTDTCLINSMNMRDQFASRILAELIRKMDSDPTGLNSSTRSHYCQVAYEWASNMMTAAANARGELYDATETTEVEMQPVGDLDTNDEKLLNNLIYSLQRTDYFEENEGVEEYSERIINPKLNEKIEGFLANSSGEAGASEYHNYEDLLDILLNPQEDVDGDVYNRVKIHNFDEVKDTLTDIKNALEAHTATVQEGFSSIVSALQSFTAQMNARFSEVNQNIANARADTIDAMPSTSNLATKTYVANTADSIIAAMPSCRYTPPSNNTEE